MDKWENNWIKWGRLVKKLPREPPIYFILIELLTGVLQLSKFSKRFYYSKNLGVGHLNCSKVIDFCGGLYVFVTSLSIKYQSIYRRL